MFFFSFSFFSEPSSASDREEMERLWEKEVRPPQYLAEEGSSDRRAEEEGVEEQCYSNQIKGLSWYIMCCSKSRFTRPWLWSSPHKWAGEQFSSFAVFSPFGPVKAAAACFYSGSATEDSGGADWADFECDYSRPPRNPPRDQILGSKWKSSYGFTLLQSVAVT